MADHDPFDCIARYYDQIMSHVDYERWCAITSLLSKMLPDRFVHLDVACGTGTLVKRMRRTGWTSFGVDLSPAMLRAGRASNTDLPAAVADARALPLDGSVDYLTCLFDSVNFLLEERDMRAGLRACAEALRPGGIFYFDFVTERMVLEHFADQRWTEDNGRFSTTWDSRYDRRNAIAHTEIRINTGDSGLIRERIYLPIQIEDAARAAGLDVLGMLDAETWKRPRRKTVRIDVVAVRGRATSEQKRQFAAIVQDVRGVLV